LALKNDNLIAATQGRSLWIIDDLTPLHSMQKELEKKEFHIYPPKTSYRMQGFGGRSSLLRGTNHPNGVMVNYFIKNLNDTTKVSLRFKEADGTLIKEFSRKAKEKKDQLKIEEGANQFVWNMRYPEAKSFDKMILWWASMNGPKALPGKYEVELQVNDAIQLVDFQIEIDPRVETDAKGLKEQFDFLIDVREKVTEAHETIIEIRDVRSQLKNYTRRLTKDDSTQPLFDKAEAIDSMMTVIENELYQTKNRSRQDPLNFPIKLTNKLGHLNSLVQGGDFPPTQQAIEVKDVLSNEINIQLAAFEKIKNVELPIFNRMVKEAQIDAIILKKE